MKSGLLIKLSETVGQSAIELALILPLLLMMTLGIYDFSQAITANNIIINMSREGASLSSRTSIETKDIMNSLAITALSLNRYTKTSMYLTTVKNTSGLVSISEQISWPANNYSALSCINNSNFSTYIKNIPVIEGSPIHIFEVNYLYQCLFFKNYAPMLHATSIF